MKNALDIKNRISSEIGYSTPRGVDLGGWTDTWFASNSKKPNQILNFGLETRLFGSNGPFRVVRVTVDHYRPIKGHGTISINAADLHYDIQIDTFKFLRGNFDKNNILLASMHVVKNYTKEGDWHIHIESPILPGASLGTSAAVSVALIKALSNHKLSNDEVAMLAWKAETEVMGGQSGTQDQWSAAHSCAVNFIDVPKYPETKHRKVKINNKVKKQLEDGLMTIFYGQHDSSNIHKKVIANLEAKGPDCKELNLFRDIAKKAEGHLLKNDLVSFGRMMKKNTIAQDKLCQGLVSNKAKALIELANIKKAIGWKVNGAGGDGGSITFLFPSRKLAEDFHKSCLIINPPALAYVYYEHQLSS